MNSKIILGFGATLLLAIARPQPTSANPLKENGNRRYSEEFYKAAFELAHCSTIFQNFTLDDMKNWVDEIAAWKAPAEIQQKFPFYQAGYDFHNLPVWVIEYGKYNIQGQIKKGAEGTKILEKYFYQGGIHLLESGVVKNGTETKIIKEGLAILDEDGFDIKQIFHAPTVSFLLKEFQTFSCILHSVLRKAIIINAPFAPQVIRVAGKLFGDLLDKAEVYTTRDQWEPALKKLIPEKSLPEFYGGSKDFKPLRVYG